MSKSANVHVFFAKLAAAMGSSNDAPSLTMLHRPPVQQKNVIAAQEAVATPPRQPRLFALELADYGVGLPPLAHC